MLMKELTLIIPAKKEAESLPSVLNELQKYNYKTDVVLHPTDLETINAIKKYDINIVYQKNLGFGDALIYGIKQCKTKYFCIFNADGSFNPKELNSMYEKVSSENFDLVFGSRYELNSGSEDDTIITYSGNKIFSFIGKFFFKLPISDILYTYVLGKTENTKKLNLESKDFSFCVELPIKAKRKGLKITTNKSYERSRIAGKKKVNAFKDGSLILISMIKLFLR
jgi:glycosyltransferase involved in cell wall biosynthesis|tara:strand:- start:79 stop:750 length:672 start_codon:yes stop_codon:yes gene_type:complete